jgi:putative spermidine/putrescine transport system permease protein
VALTAPLLLFFTLILGYPLARLLLLATRGGLLVDAAMVRALRNSIGLSLAVALISVLVCLLPAWVLARWPFRYKVLIRSAFTIPIMFSGVVVGFLAILTLGRVGLVPLLMERITGTPHFSGVAYGAAGLLLAYLYFEIPRATLALESAFREMNVDYEAAAATLGAGPLARMRRIILPQARLPIASTFLLTFSVSLGSYGVALMLSRRLTLLPVEIYTAFTGFLDDKRAATMSLILLLIATVAAASARIAEGRSA